MNNWGAGPKLKQTRILFLHLYVEGQVVLSQVTDFHPSMYEGIERQRSCMESSFFFFFSLYHFVCLFVCFPYFLQTQKGQLSTVTVSEACASMPPPCPPEPLASTTSMAMLVQSTPAEQVPQWIAFCGSSWSCVLLRLKSPTHSGFGAAFSSALHGLSLLHP